MFRQDIRKRRASCQDLLNWSPTSWFKTQRSSCISATSEINLSQYPEALEGIKVGWKNVILFLPWGRQQIELSKPWHFTWLEICEILIVFSERAKDHITVHIFKMLFVILLALTGCLFLPILLFVLWLFLHSFYYPEEKYKPSVIKNI